MRVAALGDAHLGRAYYPRTTPDGVNQRERDFELSFEAAVDLALAQRPDLVVWLGDVFDHPRPTYRSYRVAQRALAKIRDHGVPAVVISGNHDTPRLPGTGSPYSSLADAFPDVNFACRMAYERFEFSGLVVHAVPQMLTVDATLEALAAADRGRSGDKANLLLTHPRLPQVEPKHSDINEIEVDAGLLRSDFVLLGHYHSFTPVLDRIWYAGATDTFSFADELDAKGIVVLDTDSGAIEHFPIANQRPMITAEPLKALGLGTDEVQRQMIERIAAAPPGAVVRLYVEGVAPEVYRLVAQEAVREASAHVLQVELRVDYAKISGGVDTIDLPAIGSLWADYVGKQDLVDFKRDRMRALGDEYLAKAVEAAG
ncbi:MAG: DNA repair exonuclease [Actinobacteria bacterium]|nr:DNA repair exonuclease [Actinomycetota bacterium]